MVGADSCMDGRLRLDGGGGERVGPCAAAGVSRGVYLAQGPLRAAAVADVVYINLCIFTSFELGCVPI